MPQSKSQALLRALTDDCEAWVTLLDSTASCIASSASVATLLGSSVDDVLGSSFLAGIAEQDLPRVIIAIKQVTDAPGERRWLSYQRNLADGTQLPVQTALSWCEEPPCRGLLATTRLEAAATGGGRADFMRVGAAAAQASGGYSIVTVDLVEFRRIAIGIGHGQIDHLLKEVTARVRAHVADDCVVCGVGPHQIGILLPGQTDDQALRQSAGELRSRLAQPFVVGDHRIPLKAQIGFAIDVEGIREVGDVLVEAEAAASRGRGRRTLTAQAFTSGMRRADHRRLSIVSELPGALSCGELGIRLQPIVRLPSRELVGFEALVRWKHPMHGDISPAEFVPIAEELDIIAPLDRYVMATAAKLVSSWQHDSLYLSVNLSARQLHDEQLTSAIEAVASAGGLANNRIKLEITETALAARESVAMDNLNRLRELGFKLAMDDMGTGYASINQLTRLPLDVVKIDRSLTMCIADDEKVRTVVAGIRYMTRRLGIELVAEGIETETEATLSATLGAEYGQGYLFGRPMLPEDATAMVKGLN